MTPGGAPPEDPEGDSHPPRSPRSLQGGNGRQWLCNEHRRCLPSCPPPLYLLRLPSAPGRSGLLLNPFFRSQKIHSEPGSDLLRLWNRAGGVTFPYPHPETPSESRSPRLTGGSALPLPRPPRGMSPVRWERFQK